jgi:hypothetical protein
MRVDDESPAQVPARDSVAQMRPGIATGGRVPYLPTQVPLDDGDPSHVAVQELPAEPAVPLATSVDPAVATLNDRRNRWLQQQRV